MQGMWVSLKDNIKCSNNKLSDVICQPLKPSKQRSQELDKEAEPKFPVGGTNVVVNTTSCKQFAHPSTFKELGVGDQSRIVVEKILGAALRNTSKKSSKIKRVLKVNNSQKVVDKFEKYREMVKQKTKENEQKHARSLVDGNELLCFYVTTLTCHSRKLKQGSYSGPCEDLKCNVCRTINSSFEVENCIGKLGIELNMSSETLSRSIETVSKGKNMKRAVIICRIIAGRIRSIEDKITSEDEYDSLRYGGLYTNHQYLIVNNPDAVLPCFVAVLS